MYLWQQVKALNSQGLRIRQIAKKLRISRNTVKKYLRSEDSPRFHGVERVKMADQYVDNIQEMIEKGFIGTRIYEELKEMGFSGSLSTVERAVQSLRKDKERREKVTTRVETQPGRQMQYDWKQWGLVVDGKAVTVYIHETVLGYSRKKHYTFSLSITTADVIRAIHEGLIFYGGVPVELVMDNARQMVITHERSGAVLYNESFLKFMGLMGMDVNACVNYRARTKGKVERPFYHLQEHLLRGCEVKDLSEFDRRLSQYTEKVNAMVHSTTKEVPDERFKRETLRPLPAVDAALIYPRETRVVSNDGYLSWSGSHYPLPMNLALRRVLVEPVFGRAIRIYDEKGNIAATQMLSLTKGYRPLHPEHEEINRQIREKKESKKSAIVKTFTETFPSCGTYLEELKKVHGPNFYAHLKEIVSYTDLYPVSEVSSVINECMSMGAYHKNTVKRLLSARAMKVPVTVHCERLDGPPPLVRDLTLYREVLHD